MDINDFRGLVDEIDSLSNYPTILNSYNNGSSSKLYEIFIFLLVVKSLENISEVNNINFINLNNGQFKFRGNPGRIYNDDYSYVKFDFVKNNSIQTYELQLGIQHAGLTNLHEFDISLLNNEKANNCRRDQLNPRNSVLIGIECKDYSKTLGLKLAREFQGLLTDLKKNTSGKYYFVSNNIGNSVENYFSHKDRPIFKGNIVITNERSCESFVEDLMYSIRRILVYNSIEN